MAAPLKFPGTTESSRGMSLHPQNFLYHRHSVPGPNPSLVLVLRLAGSLMWSWKWELQRDANIGSIASEKVNAFYVKLRK